MKHPVKNIVSSRDFIVSCDAIGKYHVGLHNLTRQQFDALPGNVWKSDTTPCFWSKDVCDNLTVFTNEHPEEK